MSDDSNQSPTLKVLPIYNYGSPVSGSKPTSSRRRRPRSSKNPRRKANSQISPTALSHERSLPEEDLPVRMQPFSSPQEDRRPRSLQSFFDLDAIQEETPREVDWTEPGPVPRDVFDELQSALAHYKRRVEELKTSVFKAQRQLFERNQLHKAEKEDLQEKLQALTFALGRPLEATNGERRIEVDGYHIRKDGLSQYERQSRSDDFYVAIPKILTEALVGTILTRAEMSLVGKEWKSMEGHSERARAFAMAVNDGPLVAHCEFYRAIALFGQHKWEFANEASMLSRPCIGIHKTPEEWDAWMKKFGLGSHDSRKYPVPRSSTEGSPLTGVSPGSQIGWENLGDISAITSRSGTMGESPSSHFGWENLGGISAITSRSGTMVESPSSQIGWENLGDISAISSRSGTTGKSPSSPFGRENLGGISAITSRPKTPDNMSEASSFNTPIPTPRPIAKPTSEQLSNLFAHPVKLESDSSPISIPPEVWRKPPEQSSGVLNEEKPSLKSMWPFKWRQNANPDYRTLLGNPVSPYVFSIEQENISSLAELINEDASSENGADPIARVSIDRASKNSKLSAPQEKPNLELHSDSGSKARVTDSGPRTDSKPQSYLLGNLARLSSYFGLSSTDSVPEPSSAPLQTRNLPPVAENGHSPNRSRLALTDTKFGGMLRTHPSHAEVEEPARQKQGWGFSRIFGKLSGLGTPSAPTAKRAPLTADTLLQLGKELRRAAEVSSAASMPKSTGARSAMVPGVWPVEEDWDRESEIRDDGRKAVSDYGGLEGSFGSRVAVPSKKEIRDWVWNSKHGLGDEGNGTRAFADGEAWDIDDEEEDVPLEEAGDLKDAGKDVDESELRKPRSLLFWRVFNSLLEPFRRREVVTEDDLWGVEGGEGDALTCEDVGDGKGAEVGREGEGGEMGGLKSSLVGGVLCVLVERFREREVMTEEDW